MRVRARLDPGTGVLEEIWAEQPAVAFESSSLSCGESCRDPVERIRALTGTTLASGFSGRLNEAIGGPRGCTHVLTLAHLVGSTLSNLVAGERSPAAMERRASERIFARSLSFDGSLRSDAELEISVQLTDLHFAPAAEILATRDSSLIFSGGLVDSCYMWRREGALARVKERELDASREASTPTRSPDASPPTPGPRAAGTRRT